MNKRQQAGIEMQRKAQEQRRMKIAKLIDSGVRTQVEIADRLGVSKATISRDMAAMEQVYKEVAASAIEKERGISLLRLEGMIRRLYEKLERMDVAREADDEDREPESDLPTIRLIKELEERKSKLLGLDKPAKIAHTDPSGEKEATGIPEDFKRRFFGGEVIDMPNVQREVEGA